MSRGKIWRASCSTNQKSHAPLHRACVHGRARLRLGDRGPSNLRVYESQDSSITEGETTLDVVPEVAYAAVADYARWASIFPDIYAVKIHAAARR